MASMQEDVARQSLLSDYTNQQANEYGSTTTTSEDIETRLKQQDDNISQLSTGVRSVRDVAFEINKEVNSLYR